MPGEVENEFVFFYPKRQEPKNMRIRKLENAKYDKKGPPPPRTQSRQPALKTAPRVDSGASLE